MTPETIKAISDALNPLLAKLGELGNAGFDLAVRQNYVHAFTEILWIVLLLCVPAAVGIVLHRLGKGEETVRKIGVGEPTEVDHWSGKKKYASYENEVIVHTGWFDMMKNIREMDDNSSGANGVTFLAALIDLFAVLGVGYFINDLFARFFNPNYMAIMDIAKLLGK